jgi:hypothetical protein
VLPADLTVVVSGHIRAQHSEADGNHAKHTAEQAPTPCEKLGVQGWNLWLLRTCAAALSPVPGSA